MLFLDDPHLVGQPFSISQLRTYMRCPRAYQLQYLTDPRPPVQDMGASVWFGKVMQQIIQRAYHGVPLIEGHLRVWQRECGPILRVLQDWYALDAECRASGSATSNARKNWRLAHPDYDDLTARIDSFQQNHMSQWNWSERFPLSAYYRWSATFALTTRLDQVVLPYAELVEGLPVYDSEGDPIAYFADETEEACEEHYQLLHGVIGGAHVVGVPDQFGIDPDGIAWISDNKVTTAHLTSQELGEDQQLAAYSALLQQNGWIGGGQPLRVGHCYISEKDPPRYVWSDTSRYDLYVLPQLHALFAQLKATIEQDGPFLGVRGLQPSAFSPCRSCGVRQLCLSSLRTASEEVMDVQFRMDEELTL